MIAQTKAAIRNLGADCGVEELMLMRVLLVVASAAGMPLLLHGQADFAAKLRENRQAISVRNGQLTGPGAALLNSAIARSRFVLLGETHGVSDTARFAEAVCRAAAPERFGVMAIEE